MHAVPKFDRVDLDQRGNDTTLGIRLQLPGRLVPKSIGSGDQGEMAFSAIVEGKESNHVTSNDLLGNCIHFRRHRVHCHDLN
jgi:hypothetical protein